MYQEPSELFTDVSVRLSSDCVNASYLCTQRRCGSAGRPWRFPQGRTYTPADPPGPGRSPASSSHTRDVPERSTFPPDIELHTQLMIKLLQQYYIYLKSHKFYVFYIVIKVSKPYSTNKKVVELMSSGGCTLHSTPFHSPHILPLSTEPGLQNREGLLLSRDLGSATIISEDTWKLDSGCLASVRFRRLVSCSRVRRSLF